MRPSLAIQMAAETYRPHAKNGIATAEFAELAAYGQKWFCRPGSGHTKCTLVISGEL
jgi:hypothetical protein